MCSIKFNRYFWDFQDSNQSKVRCTYSSTNCFSLAYGGSVRSGWSKQVPVAPDGQMPRIDWEHNICGEDGCASRPMLSLVRWKVWNGSGGEGGSVMRLGGSGLERRGGSIVGSWKEAEAWVTLLGCSIEGGGDEGGGVEGGGGSVAHRGWSIDNRSGEDRWVNGSIWKESGGVDSLWG